MNEIPNESISENQDLFTIPEEAAKLKVKPSWLYARTRVRGPGSIPRIQVGKYIRFDHEAVMAWLKK